MKWGRIILVAFIPATTSAQISDAEFELKARQGIDHVYNLEFELADSTFERLIQIRPRDPAGHFFLAMVDWWRIMTDLDDTQYDERFLGSLEKVIDLCDELLEENEDDVMALFFKGGALGFEGRLNFHRDDWLAAANAGREALPLVTTASAADPGNYDIYLGTGIYNYYAEVIPDRYPMAKPLLLFIPPGDKAAGIAQLQMAAERGKYAHIEAKYFLMQLFYQFEQDFAKALSLAQELSLRYPDNMLFHRYVGRCYVSMGNFPEANRVFGEVSRNSKVGKKGYNSRVEREAEYYLGLSQMNAGNYDSAIGHFRACDRLSHQLDLDGQSGFMVLANLNIGKMYDLQLDRGEALAHYERVLEMTEYRDSHTQAETYIEAPFTR